MNHKTFGKKVFKYQLNLKVGFGIVNKFQWKNFINYINI